MPNFITMDNEEAVKELRKYLGRAFQSAHINFLIGSGASMPAIETSGDVEKELECLYSKGCDEDANFMKRRFIAGIQKPTNLLLGGREDHKVKKTVDNYTALLDSIRNILFERKSNLVPKRANIFTTNYDLFVEKASEQLENLIVNDGFLRTPDLSMTYKFIPETYFNKTTNTGSLYAYEAEVPTINLIKIHGSLSWAHGDNAIIFNANGIESLDSDPSSCAMKEYLKKIALVLPESRKFQTTVLDRFHYDLLRIYANSLELENSLLIVFGFSFSDEHVREVTVRALRNATLKVVIFAYSQDQAKKLSDKLPGRPNVEIVSPDLKGTLEFPDFLRFLDTRPISAGTT